MSYADCQVTITIEPDGTSNELEDEGGGGGDYSYVSSRSADGGVHVQLSGSLGQACSELMLSTISSYMVGAGLLRANRKAGHEA